MNGTKLSLILLLTAVTCVQAEAPKKDAAKPVIKAPQKDYFKGGKECATLLTNAISTSDQAAQTSFMQKSQEYLQPVMEVFQKADATPAQASKAWKSFQDFNRGFKEVFDKNPPKAPAGISALEKKGSELNMDAQRMSYNVALESKDFASYNKAMQEKAQSLMAKQLELQKEFQAQMAAQANATPADKK